MIDFVVDTFMSSFCILSDKYIPMNIYALSTWKSFTLGNYNLAKSKMLLKQVQRLLDPRS